MSASPAHGQVAHFSINSDDVERAKAFYAAVFDWKYEPYGPPGFFMVSFPDKAKAPVLGSVQGRRELVPGVRMNGFECTIAVRDIHETATKIEACGGKIVMPVATLPGIGHLLFFQDTEGTLVGAMQYEAAAR